MATDSGNFSKAKRTPQRVATIGDVPERPEVGEMVVIEDLTGYDASPLFQLSAELSDGDFDDSASDYVAVWVGDVWTVIDQDTGGGSSGGTCHNVTHIADGVETKTTVLDAIHTSDDDGSISVTGIRADDLTPFEVSAGNYIKSEGCCAASSCSHAVREKRASSTLEFQHYITDSSSSTGPISASVLSVDYTPAQTTTTANLIVNGGWSPVPDRNAARARTASYDVQYSADGGLTWSGMDGAGWVIVAVSTEGNFTPEYEFTRTALLTNLTPDQVNNVMVRAVLTSNNLTDNQKIRATVITATVKWLEMEAV